ncbi:pyridoxal phosphate-dependent transferase [Melanogaster broomeanus]|nr:pyridoxal phosphate-dependent transferase [Melanogaster broomeanus]
MVGQVSTWPVSGPERIRFAEIWLYSSTRSIVLCNLSEIWSQRPEVLIEAGKGLLNFQNTGIGIAEISHRSPEFDKVIREFSAVVLNMLAKYRSREGTTPDKPLMDYVVTGSWSEAAMREAKRLGLGPLISSSTHKPLPRTGGRLSITSPIARATKKSSPRTQHSSTIAPNETVHGVEFDDDLNSPTSFPFDALPENVPLVADYSSSFMSRPIPCIEKHAVIFAGAQKNIGPAGVTVVIVRDEWANVVDNSIPLCLSYKTLIGSRSLHNTPPVLSYISQVSGWGAERKAREKALEYYAECTNRKASKLYAALKEGESRGVFKGKVLEGSGSKMNEKLKQFVSDAERRGMGGIKGHRSVGGMCRISLYNAVTEDQVNNMIQYMNEFA